MANALKTKGIDEISSLRRRVNRQYTLRRISRPDRDTLSDLLDKLEARIIHMTEKSPDLGDEEW